MSSQPILYQMLSHQHCRVEGEVKESPDVGSSRSAFPDLSSKKHFTIFYPHQENSPALSTFSQKKSLFQRVQELGGKGEAAGRKFLLSTFFSENICSMSTDFFIFISMKTIGIFYELFL